MATVSRKLMLASIKDFMTSGIYSDLTITCGSESYKVHKIVVCGRADFFARALRFGGQESQTGEINLGEDEPEVIKLLMQYLYEGEYEPAVPDDGVGGTLTPPRYYYEGGSPYKSSHTSLPTLNGTAPQLLTHTKMYEIGDKYDVIGLKDLAKEKFARACKHFWKTPEFASAAHHAFSTTVEDDKGLRGIVSARICEHIELVNDPGVSVLMTQFNGLALGVLQAKVNENRWD